MESLWIHAKPDCPPSLPNQVLRPPPGYAEDTRPKSLPQHSEMPARLRGTLHRSIARPLDSAGIFYCRSCTTWRRALSTRATSINKIAPARQNNRLFSSITTSSRPITTSTAVSTVPPQFKELHDALSGIKDATIEQVSVSRLQLALRGLESETPLIRIAGECSYAQLLAIAIALGWLG